MCFNQSVCSSHSRECAIKFNDYFEFPREFDMEPYTVAGLAKIEGKEMLSFLTCLIIMRFYLSQHRKKLYQVEHLEGINSQCFW